MRSINELTFREEDFISILGHYCIPDFLRNDLYDKFKINTESFDYYMAGFVRLASFWVRRRYYEYYRKDLFKKRYPLEDISFYDKQFDFFTKKVIELIQV